MMIMRRRIFDEQQFPSEWIAAVAETYPRPSDCDENDDDGFRSPDKPLN